MRWFGAMQTQFLGARVPAAPTANVDDALAGPIEKIKPRSSMLRVISDDRALRELRILDGQGRSLKPCWWSRDGPWDYREPAEMKNEVGLKAGLNRLGTKPFEPFPSVMFKRPSQEHRGIIRRLSGS